MISSCHAAYWHIPWEGFWETWYQGSPNPVSTYKTTMCMWCAWLMNCTVRVSILAFHMHYMNIQPWCFPLPTIPRRLPTCIVHPTRKTFAMWKIARIGQGNHKKAWKQEIRREHNSNPLHTHTHTHTHTHFQSYHQSHSDVRVYDCSWFWQRSNKQGKHLRVSAYMYMCLEA